ncbi:hypothetical protein EVAR_65962_1 [Eumeta japonica]|uniref:Uncharacterized protein n=1 Tax=Eumeta variegata TaxID=151549 RepID=A0A4C1ZAV8_EUMVA|nr:hypothetical protein EVAR_65962_1 [Eumeta japonica]
MADRRSSPHLKDGFCDANVIFSASPAPVARPRVGAARMETIGRAVPFRNEFCVLLSAAAARRLSRRRFTIPISFRDLQLSNYPPLRTFRTRLGRQEAGNALVTLLELHVFMGSGDHYREDSGDAVEAQYISAADKEPSAAARAAPRRGARYHRPSRN